MVPEVSAQCGYLPLGDLATWVGSIGTVAAAVVALVLFLANMVDRRKSQARLVVGYMEGMPAAYARGAVISTDSVPGKQATQFEGGTIDVAALPRNAAGKVTADPAAAADCISFVWVLENNSDEMIADVVLEMLSPAGKVALRIAERRFIAPRNTLCQQEVVRDDGRVVGGVTMRVTFTDSVGRRWARVAGLPLRKAGKDAAEPGVIAAGSRVVELTSIAGARLVTGDEPNDLLPAK